MPEFIQLAGAVSAAEAKVDRVGELSAADLAPTIEIAAAEAALAIAEAEVKRDELRGALEALVARASDIADVEQLADNLAGYEGTLPQQIRVWQQAAGLPVTGIVDDRRRGAT